MLQSNTLKKTQFHYVDSQVKRLGVNILKEDGVQNQGSLRIKQKISKKGYTKLVFESLENICCEVWVDQLEQEDEKELELFQKKRLNLELEAGEVYFYYENKVQKFLGLRNCVKKCVNEQKDQKSLIISTDLGGTLCGDAESMKKFNQYYLQNHYFEKNNTLIYNTGRGYKSFLEMRKREKLLNPNYLITRCGCGIFENKKGQFVEDLEWKNQILLNWEPDLIKKHLHEIKYLEEKERCDNDGMQMNLKYLVKTDWTHHVAQELTAKMKNLVEEFQIKQEIKFEYYVREKSSGISVEILPFLANKGKSLIYLLNKNKQKIEDVIAFGDSMNDTGMLILGNKGILVQNSNSDVKKWAEENKQKFKNLSISNHTYASALFEQIQDCQN